MNLVIHTRVSGVTFEGRQEIVKRLAGNEPCKLVPEPTNPHDPNAIKVLVYFEGEVLHVGYIPKYLAAQIAPHLEGEDIMAYLEEVTGGFGKASGEIASWGLKIRIELPQ